jgi:hypothetical protein
LVLHFVFLSLNRKMCLRHSWFQLYGHRLNVQITNTGYLTGRKNIRRRVTVS